MSDSKTESGILQAFKKWDEDGDGVITQEELTTVFTALGMPEDEIEVLFESADQNKDGVIDYQEFFTWLFSGDAPEEVRQLATKLPFIRFDTSAVCKKLRHGEEVFINGLGSRCTVNMAGDSVSANEENLDEGGGGVIVIEREAGDGDVKDGDPVYLKCKDTEMYLECVSDDRPLIASELKELGDGKERQRFVIQKQGRPLNIEHRDTIFLTSWVSNLVQIDGSGALSAIRWARKEPETFEILKAAVLAEQTTALARKMQFQAFDLDGNGSIHRAEMKYMLKKIKGTTDDDELDEIMGKLGDEGSGAPYDAFASWADEGGLSEELLQHAETFGNIAQRCQDALHEEDALIEVLSTLDTAGVKALKNKYKATFDVDLQEKLETKCGEQDGWIFSNYWKTAMMGMLEDEVDLWTRSLYDAMNGWGTDESTLTALVCTIPERLSEQIHKRYEEKYGKTLLSHIKSEVSCDYKNVLLMQARLPAQCRAEAMQQAMDGIGTSEEQLIRVVCGLDLGERKELCAAYSERYGGDDLVKEVLGEISGDFAKAMKIMLTAEVGEFDLEADCKAMKKAMDGWGTDESTLMKMICSKTQRQMEDINAMFPEIDGGKRLFNRVRDETSGHFQTTLLGCIRHPMRQLAYSVRECMEGWGTNETGLITLLVHLPDFKKEALIKMYKEIHDRDLLEDIASETSGNFKEALLALVKPAPKVWAGALKGAMKGLGTSDELLINFMCLARDDMNEVREEFLNLTGESLSQWIKGDCSGDYAKTLVALAERDSEEKINMLPIYWAQRCKDALNDFATLKEVLTALPPVAIKLGTKIYENVYGEDLRKAIGKKCNAKSSFFSFSNYLKNSMKALVEMPVDLRVRALNEAMEGLGTDEFTLTGLICTIPENSHKDIAKLYEEKYGKSLLDHIRDETSFNYKYALEYQAMPKIDSRCLALNRAMGCIGTVEKQLIRVLLFSTHKERTLIRARYEEMFEKPLIEHLLDETSGSFQAALVAIVEAPDHKDDDPDYEADCDALKDAMDGCGTDEEELVRIIAKKTPDQIAALKEKYNEKFDESLFDRVNDETFDWGASIFAGDDFRQTMLGLLRDPKRQLAYSVRDCIVGFGTDDIGLITCLVHLTEMEKVSLKEIYAEIKDGGDLYEHIKGDTSGDYETALLALVKPQPQVYAEALLGAMKGLGTSDNLLINWLCICKDRMDEVREAFKEVSDGKELVDWIESECSGDYKETLMMLASRDCFKYTGAEVGIQIPPPLSEGQAKFKFSKAFNAMCSQKKKNPDEDLVIPEEFQQEMANAFLYYGNLSSCKPNLDKKGVWDLTNAIGFPPADDGPDLDATFTEWNQSGSGQVTWNDFIGEMTTRVNDPNHYEADPLEEIDEA